jgi:hypothetical protein
VHYPTYDSQTRRSGAALHAAAPDRLPLYRFVASATLVFMPGRSCIVGHKREYLITKGLHLATPHMLAIMRNDQLIGLQPVVATTTGKAFQQLSDLISICVVIRHAEHYVCWRADAPNHVAIPSRESR